MRKHLLKKIIALLAAFSVIVSMALPSEAYAAYNTAQDSGMHGYSSLTMDKYTGEINNKIEDNILGYKITSMGLYNTKTHEQFLQGYFYNASDKYHIMELEQTEVVVQDLKGNYLFEAAATDYSQIEEIILPPRTKVEYYIYVACDGYLKYNIDEIEAYVVCEFLYQECSGEGCEICGGPVSKEVDIKIEKKSTTKDRATTKSYDVYGDECSLCGGLGGCDVCFGEGYVDCSSCFNGRCSGCGGTGEILSRGYKDINRRDCSRCRGSGDCSKCGGIGELKCSRCNGRGTCPLCGQ